MKTSLLAGIAVATAALALPGATLARTQAAKATTVRVTAKDFAFVLSPKTVPRGQVTFVITNVSPAAHDFAIAGRTSKTIGPRATTRMTVTLKPGSYSYRCTVDSHAQLGMKGMLKVT